MLNFGDVKIGMRLAAGFGLLLILVVALGVLGLNGMAKINQDLDRIVRINYSSIKLTNAVPTTVASLVVGIEQLAMKDQAGKIEGKKEIDVLRLEYRATIEKLEKEEVDDKAKGLITAAKRALDDARPANDKVIELSLANKTFEALDSYYKEASPLDLKVKAAFKALVSQREARMAMRHAEAVKEFDDSRLVCLALIGASLLLGLLVSVTISRSITISPWPNAPDNQGYRPG